MIKVLSYRYHKSLGPFNMLTVRECSETGLFRHLSYRVFRSPYFLKYISYEGHLFFSKCSKKYINFRNGKKNSEKLIRSLDNCIWIGCCKFSLLRREYLSLAVNVLTECPMISHITKRDIFQVIFAHLIKVLSCRFRKCLVPFKMCWLSEGVLKACFLGIGLTKFFAVCIFGNK